ncbi:MAG TPA: sigma 54-interacting transcriptional regulator, partial [Candidatus Sumerlaeota bacterium]|nr:sigma 54-interacting transcriptional regulator [Candidatus Sumerlaeota bacterium]
VAEMSPRLQVKLLRVLQEREFEPVGDIRTIRVDVRIVAASNRDLKVGIREGWFREDLYYRLNVIPIHLPPLRERREDIPALVDHFLNVYNARNRTNVSRLTREVLDLLVSYDWPGNVRELENCIERVVVMSPGDTLSLDLLPEEIVAQKKKNEEPGVPPSGQIEEEIERACEQIGDLGRARENLLQLVEKAVIRRGLTTGRSQRELSETLGVSRMTLRKKIRELGIE